MLPEQGHPHFAPEGGLRLGLGEGVDPPGFDSQIGSAQLEPGGMDAVGVERRQPSGYVLRELPLPAQFQVPGDDDAVEVVGQGQHIVFPPEPQPDGKRPADHFADQGGQQEGVRFVTGHGVIPPRSAIEGDGQQPHVGRPTLPAQTKAGVHLGQAELDQLVPSGVLEGIILLLGEHPQFLALVQGRFPKHQLPEPHYAGIHRIGQVPMGIPAGAVVDQVRSRFPAPRRGWKRRQRGKTAKQQQEGKWWREFHVNPMQGPPFRFIGEFPHRDEGCTVRQNTGIYFSWISFPGIVIFTMGAKILPLPDEQCPRG